MPKVYIRSWIPEEVVKLITPYAEVNMWQKAEPPTHEEFLHNIADIDGLLTWGLDKVDSALMDAAPKLKVIANISVGYDNIDFDAATKRGIKISNTPGVLTDTTADLTFTIMLAFARRIPLTTSVVVKGEWKKWGIFENPWLGWDVHHKTLGIIGLGRVGSAVARRAKGFSMKVIYYDIVRRQPQEEAELGVEFVKDIPTLLSMSDYVSLHVPLDSSTRHLIGEKELSLMKPTAILVNSARGGVVDQKALYEALKQKQIKGAAVDVVEVEPIPEDDPILALDNILITPHIGGATKATREKMCILAAQNMAAALKGEPMPTCVNCHLLGKK